MLEKTANFVLRFGEEAIRGACPRPSIINEPPNWNGRDGDDPKICEEAGGGSKRGFCLELWYFTFSISSCLCAVRIKLRILCTSMDWEGVRF